MDLPPTISSDNSTEPPNDNTKMDDRDMRNQFDISLSNRQSAPHTHIEPVSQYPVAEIAKPNTCYDYHPQIQSPGANATFQQSVQPPGANATFQNRGDGVQNRGPHPPRLRPTSLAPHDHYAPTPGTYAQPQLPPPNIRPPPRPPIIDPRSLFAPQPGRAGCASSRQPIQPVQPQINNIKRAYPAPHTTVHAPISRPFTRATVQHGKAGFGQTSLMGQGPVDPPPSVIDSQHRNNQSSSVLPPNMQNSMPELLPRSSPTYSYITSEMTAQPLSALLSIQTAQARVIRRGYMEKKGEYIPNWRRRYFVLYSNGQLLGWGSNPLEAPGFDDDKFYESAQYISKGPMNNFHIREAEVQTENRNLNQLQIEAEMEAELAKVAKNTLTKNTSLQDVALSPRDPSLSQNAEHGSFSTRSNVFLNQWASSNIDTSPNNPFDIISRLLPPNDSKVRHWPPKVETRTVRDPYRMHLRISHNDLERSNKTAIRYLCMYTSPDLIGWVRSIQLVKTALRIKLNSESVAPVVPLPMTVRPTSVGAVVSSSHLNMDDTEENLPNQGQVIKLNTQEYLFPSSGYNSVAEEMESLAEKEKEIRLNDFELLKVLGRGTFGKVVLAREKTTLKYWAIKLIRKDLIFELNDVEHSRNEAAIIQKLRHPFLVRCMYTFEDSHRICHVMEYANGGELHEHLRISHRFSENRARFYTAEITLALFYLHRKRIVYRDLKLENILLDHSGHILLADFGLCKQTPNGREILTTLCGTPEYMSPELLDDDQYAHSVDWWGLGVVLYAMLSGRVPFYDAVQVTLFEKILWMEPQVLPRQRSGALLSRQCQDLCFRLLMKDPDMRIGCRIGPSGGIEIMAHQWFKDLDFEALYHRQITPPWTPQCKDVFDTQYFCPNMTRETVCLTPVEEMNQDALAKMMGRAIITETYDASKPTNVGETKSRWDMNSATFEN